ncbi:MAG: cation-transporting P-type ATPase [Chromatiales bacterium]|nr:cation-transporting P-type ATPase [Chromatiales bacterium]
MTDTPKDPAESRADWHAQPADEVVHALDADAGSGLSASDAAQRKEKHGPNTLTPAAPRSAFRRLLSQFNNLFIGLLLAAGVITALLGEYVDSGVIFGVVLVIALIGFIQEGRAERALEAVRGMLSQKAWVLRDGQRREIAAEDLVPGDVLLLDAGDRVPADARLVKVRSLQVAEAALTGESTPVEKSPDPVDARAAIGDRSSMVYLGTLVTAGQASAVVTGTGDDTEIGHISGMLSSIVTLRTPLMQRLDEFTRVLTIVILALAAVTFLIGVLVWGSDWGEMFFAAVSLAVAAIPEGLPAVMTVTLAIGVERMARRNAIIRRLPAVETLGSVTVICSDKTGTLTRNEMAVRTVRAAGTDLQVEGVGYQPRGGLLRGDKPTGIEEHPVALELARAALLCNDASVEQQDGEWVPKGDPTEAALVVLAMKLGLEPAREQRECPRLDVIPFASERRYMASLHHDHKGGHWICVKGAPERILELCDRELRSPDEHAPLDHEAWAGLVEEIAARGQRVLAVARLVLDSELRELDEKHVVEGGLELLGLLGLIDPPREEAVKAVAACQEAGIRVKMITGDHALTAQAIARELGLASTDQVLTGNDLEEMDDEALRNAACEVDVFARTSPEHKLRLVEALQFRGEVTAMTGDGVNDAPALKRADVGIAMGNKGTEAAREASEMVLADDNFASIARAVEEGRTVYDNLRKAILFILPTNAAQALVIVTAILMGLVLPVTPVQILWVNMITAITLGIAFAWEPAEGELMHRPPRRASEPLLDGFIIWRILFVGSLLLVGVLLLFTGELQSSGSEEYARTMAVNALVMGQIFYVLNARYFIQPVLTWDGLAGNRVVVGAIAACIALQLLFTYLPLMNRLFGTAPLDLGGWLRCILVGLAVFTLVELEKWWWRRRRSGS